jgi:hypothetical protein
MYEGDHHLIAKHTSLLPTLEDENDEHSKTKNDVGVEVDREE